MKTIWKRRNIVKVLVTMLLVAAVFAAVSWWAGLDIGSSAVGGGLLGMLAMQLALLRWPCWEFQ